MCFSWGRIEKDYINAHDFDYRYIVDIGFIWDDVYNRRRESGERLLKSKINEKSKFIIGLFNSSYNWESPCSPEMYSFFYEAMLEMVKAHPDWALVIKPKSHNNLSNILKSEKIDSLINELTAERRCLKLIPEHNIYDVARISDVCVCNGISTVGTIAALMGEKAIYWGLMGATRHPYYLYGRGATIFESKDEIETALEHLCKYKNEEKNIGDHSSWIDDIDPYRDGNAGVRAGKLIKAYLDHAGKKENIDTALEKSIREFEKKWGKDKIHSFEERNEALNDNIFNRAERELKR